MTTPVECVAEVTVAPDVAFAIFQDEIGRWWRPGPSFANDPARMIGMRFERGVAGRWLELYDDLGDDAFAMGTTTAWEPGARLTFDYHSAFLPVPTVVDLWFEPIDNGTRITLQHGGWDALGDDAARRRDGYQEGWESILEWYVDWTTWGSPLRIPDRANPRQGYVLQPGEGIDGDSSLKASRRSSGGSLTVIESTAGGGAPPHVHAFDDEVFYVIRGRMTVGLDGVTHEFGAGGVAFIPRGVVHEWDAAGDEVTVLIVTSPGGLEEFLHELHTSADPYPVTWNRIGPRFGYRME